MPPKSSKKVVASAGRTAQGRPGQRKNISSEVVADSDSGDEFEHLAVEAEDRYPFFFFHIHRYLHVFISLTALTRWKWLRSAMMKLEVRVVKSQC